MHHNGYHSQNQLATEIFAYVCVYIYIYIYSLRASQRRGLILVVFMGKAVTIVDNMAVIGA